MCTALSFQTKDRYFGRTLDLDRFFREEVCVMPRNFPLHFRLMGQLPTHYAMLGMASVVEGIPLFYEGANEHGLAMAGLNFPGNARYFPPSAGADNIAPFEFIPWVLSQCRTLEEAKVLLSRLNLADIPFSAQIPQAPLHWMISGGGQSLVAESTAQGLHLYENPLGVLTNNPPFPQQLENYRRYRSLRVDNQGIPRDEAYSLGLGAVGLPGDLSSMSRFVRMAFGQQHARCGGEETDSVAVFFHLLSSVQMIRGLCKTDRGGWDRTGYSTCINTDRGLYYYTTYENRRICCVDLHRTDLDSRQLSRYPLEKSQSIQYQN